MSLRWHKLGLRDLRERALRKYFIDTLWRNRLTGRERERAGVSLT